MKVLIFLMAMAAMFSSLSVLADGYLPICGLGISYDSYGRGIEDGFKATAKRARLLDETCYGFGKQFGKKTRAENSWSFCTSDFERGLKDGYALQSQSADGECFSQGYKAGEAALDIDARDGKAAPACQSAYASGAKDWNTGTAPIVPGDHLEAHCYQMGNYHASAGTANR